MRCETGQMATSMNSSSIVDDPAGNSFVQPLSTKDGALTTTHYDRSDEDAIALGFRPGEHSRAEPRPSLEGVDGMPATPSGRAGGHDLRGGLPPLQSAGRGAEVRRQDPVLQGVRHHVLFVRGVRV